MQLIKSIYVDNLILITMNIYFFTRILFVILTVAIDNRLLLIANIHKHITDKCLLYGSQSSYIKSIYFNYHLIYNKYT
jgi:hypothetical protein